MSHLKIETCSSQEPSLGLADSRGFPAVPRCPIYSFSKNRGSPRGPSSNAPLSCAGRVAWGNGVTSVSFWFFGPQKHGYHNMNPTRIFFLFNLSYIRRDRGLKAVASPRQIRIPPQKNTDFPWGSFIQSDTETSAPPSPALLSAVSVSAKKSQLSHEAPAALGAEPCGSSLYPLHHCPEGSWHMQGPWNALFSPSTLNSTAVDNSVL